MSDRAIVTISNRLPVAKTSSGWRASAGGLVTALKPVMESRPGAWVGWDGGAEDVPAKVPDLSVRLRPVSLSRAEVNAFYHGFSNRSIWPLFHDLVQPATFDRAWWENYRVVNERFAGETARLRLRGAPDALLWVQDYHLMLLPQMLRRRRPDAPIAFFLHIPWPAPELFSRLPWREEILRGLLGADVVSFHTDRYRKNFVRTCGRLLDCEVSGRTITMDGHTVSTSACPISIDAKAFERLATSDEVENELARLRKQFSGRRVLAGVDRLDYTKGILERLEALEQLLERRPDLRTKLTFVQIAVPSRGAVREYRELRTQIEQVIGRINGRFTEPGHDVPVYYLHRGVPLPRLIAYYRLADVFLVTPLKDGLNLVSKEYVVSQAAGGDAGALVLSEFTGAALELERAILCNPFDIDGVSNAIERALEMSADERRERLADMAKRVRRNDVFRWLDRQLREVDRVLG
ncbi:MAG TPA: trehalose-6-phosphate synthase [Actinomycetota bacterium]|nr:trehalose-6-phosphate synthase [Actinomycetota bacterium]